MSNLSIELEKVFSAKDRVFFEFKDSNNTIKRREIKLQEDSTVYWLINQLKQLDQASIPVIVINEKFVSFRSDVEYLYIYPSSGIANLLIRVGMWKFNKIPIDEFLLLLNRYLKSIKELENANNLNPFIQDWDD